MLFLVVFCTVSAQTNNPPSLGQSRIASSFDMNPISAHQFKVDDYIRAAISLQAMGRDAACQALLASAKTNAPRDYRYFVLCRMLFTQRGTNVFQVPFRGGCVYYIGGAGDWPLDPIALVDGVPFFLTGSCGYSGSRSAETVESYLNYCMTNCNWNAYTFHEVTAGQKRDALAKLLSSDKAKQPLKDLTKEFFQSQIE